MSDYMKEFKQQTGYMSLKEEYVRAMTKVQEKFDNNMEVEKPEDMDEYFAEAIEDDDESLQEQQSGNPKQNFMAPLQRRELEIRDLKEAVAKQEKEALAARKEKL